MLVSRLRFASSGTRMRILLFNSILRRSYACLPHRCLIYGCGWVTRLSILPLPDPTPCRGVESPVPSRIPYGASAMPAGPAAQTIASRQTTPRCKARQFSLDPARTCAAGFKYESCKDIPRTARDGAARKEPRSRAARRTPARNPPLALVSRFKARRLCRVSSQGRVLANPRDETLRRRR